MESSEILTLLNDLIDNPWARKTAYALISLVVVLVLAKLVSLAANKLTAKIKDWRGSKIKAIRLQNVTFVEEANLVHYLLLGLLLLRKALIFVLFAWWVLITVGLFASVEDVFYQALGSAEAYLSEALLNVWNYIPKLLLIGVVIGATMVVLRFVRIFFREIEKGNIRFANFHADWAQTTSMLAQMVVGVFALTLIVPNLPGSDSDAFKGISIFVGILVSLGSTSAVRNIVAGVVLTYMRSFRNRDFVKIQETLGTVKERGLLVTRICTPHNEEVFIPNTEVLDSQVTNYSTYARDKGTIFKTKVTVVYETPWETVHKLLLEAANRTNKIMKDPKPFVLQLELHDFYVVYQLNGFVKEPEQWIYIYSDLHQNIQNVFRENNVELNTPTHLHIRGPLPDVNLKKLT